MFELLTTLFVVFMAGVGVGAFVLATRLRKIVAEAVLFVKNEEKAVATKLEQIKKAL